MPTESLRVLRIITRLNIGGPAHEIASLCRHAPAHDAHTVLAAGHAGPDEGDGFDSLDLGTAERVRIAGLGRAPGVVRDLRAATALLRLIDVYRPHVVHTHTSKAGVLGRVVAAAAGVPVVCHTYHGHAFEGHFGSVASAIMAAAERWLARRTDALIVLGARSRAALEQMRIGTRIEVIPPGFDCDRLSALRGGCRAEARAALGLADDQLVLLAFGRLARVKGIDLLLSALARLGPRVAGAHLLVAGDGPERAALTRAAADPDLVARVRFLGWRDDPARLFAAADLLVVPSRSEGYPHAVIEARAAGCPVLATRVGEVTELVEEGRTGRLVAADCVGALADCLAALLADREALVTLRRHAAVTPHPARDDVEFAAQTFALYRQLHSQVSDAARGSKP